MKIRKNGCSTTTLRNDLQPNEGYFENEAISGIAISEMMSKRKRHKKTDDEFQFDKI